MISLRPTSLNRIAVLASQRMSYASVAADRTGSCANSTNESSCSSTDNGEQHAKGHQGSSDEIRANDDSPSKRSPAPSHIPKTTSEEESVYILTLHTNVAHHKRMTELRNKYFPKHLNKLAAHLTLFHALPGSQLESSIIPVIEEVAVKTAPFDIHALQAFKLKRGIAISVPKDEGGQQAQAVHRALQQAWLKEGFLSDQDKGGFRVHYTIMNKVEEQSEIDQAFEEVQKEFGGDRGIVEGLGLYRYDRGFWRWKRKFLFQSPSTYKTESS